MATDLRDLGLHRLKDLAEPVRLYQLGEHEFPPLRSLNATNLPVQPNALIGREREVSEVIGLVCDGARLVTLTGPGGTGKTRLALQAAAELVDDFPDGVFWVSLAPLRDPDLVVPTIEQTLGAKQRLSDHVDEQRVLLLLDNLEQVVDCAPGLAEVLTRCPNLHLLVTSRVVLKLHAEVEYGVDPLESGESVQLFRERAVVANPVDAVVEICRRLDGLPLAVELAAARTRMLPPEKLLERLETRLPLLTGGTRDAPERQKTLRATIEWSYDLLDETEQPVFARLSVFAGGCSLEAAEAVCGADLDTLTTLVEHSLTRQDEGRFSMLETIREFAVEKLREGDEQASVLRRHAAYFRALALASSASDLDRFGADYGNFRAALERLTETDESILDLATQLAFFWRARGYFAEGRAWLDRAIERGGGEMQLRGRALSWAATFARRQGDYEAAKRYARSRIDLREDGAAAAEALTDLGVAMMEEGDLAGARPLVLRAREEAERAGHPDALFRALVNAGLLHVIDGDYAVAERELEEAYRLAAQSANAVYIAFALGAIGQLRRRQGRRKEAKRALSEALERFGEIDAPEGVITIVEQIAAVLADEGLLEPAAQLLAAADHLRNASRYPVAPLDRHDRTALEARIRADLDAGSYRAARDTGGRLELVDVVELAGRSLD